MQHVERGKTTNAWDDSPRLLDLLKRKIMHLYEGFTVCFILIYLELCCTLDFKCSCILFTVWKHVFGARGSSSCTLPYFCGILNFYSDCRGWWKGFRKVSHNRSHDRQKHSVLTQVGSLLAVHRKVHIFYQWCAILMKGQFLESFLFLISLKQNEVWNVFDLEKSRGTQGLTF